METLAGWKFICLVHALRHVSMPISTEEIFEAQTCLVNYPDISPKQILKTVFVRRSQDESIFEMVWETLIENPTSSESEYHIDLLKELNTTQNSNIGGLGQGRGWGGISLTAKGTLDDPLSSLKPITSSQLAALARNGKEYEEIVTQALAQMNYYGWINAYELAYKRGNITEEELFLHKDMQKALIKELRKQLLVNMVKQENSWLPIQRQHWLFKSLSTLTEDEKCLVKESIRKWTRKLALRLGVSWRRRHKGNIDVSRLIQQSVQGDGKIFKLNYRQRIPRSSEVAILCDISNSVASYVEFLLYLVSCLKDRLRKIKVFLFIDRIWEVEGVEKEADLEQVMREIKSLGQKESSGFSDYGEVFREFANDKLGEVSSRATLLILGDGKNNYRPTKPEYLAQISDKLRKVYWLNPLNYKEWEEPDNALKYYRDHCTKVYSCRSARDLQRIVQGVF